MGNMVKSLIIYDKINIDSIFSAALLKYGYDNNLLKNDDEIEITFISTDKEFNPDEYDNFTLLNCLIDGNKLYQIYVQNTDFTFLLYDNKLVKKISKEFPNANMFSLSNNAFLDSDKGSCSMYVYRQLKGNADIPIEIKYISSFELDNYPDYGFTREEVLNYNYGLIKKYNNSFNELYGYVSGLLGHLLNNDDSSYLSVEQISSEGESYGNYIDDFIIYNYNVYKGIEINVDNTRKCILIQTPYELSSNIISNELFEQYDNIMTFYFLNDGSVRIGLYDLPPVFYKEDENDLTDSEREELIVQASFNVEEYLAENYNGYGNELYGFATLNVETFYNMIRTRKF